MKEMHKQFNDDKKVAYIDIDETICFYDKDRIYENAVPNYNNIEKINKLYDNEWIIIYWTARGSSQIENKNRISYLTELTKQQLIKWGAKFHDLKMGDQKPFYDLIIDDKAKRIEEL